MDMMNDIARHEHGYERAVSIQQQASISVQKKVMTLQGAGGAGNDGKCFRPQTSIIDNTHKPA